MNTRGIVWISAVIYIALGLVAVTIILSSSLPLINNLKDKSTYMQSKVVLYEIDKNIQQVINEGPGSKRFIDTVIIKGGRLHFIATTQGSLNQIKWEDKTEATIVEVSEKDANCAEKGSSCILIKEGNLNIYEEKTIIKDEYNIVTYFTYDKIKLIFAPASTQGPTDITGKFSLTVENQGLENNQVKLYVKIS